MSTPTRGGLKGRCSRVDTASVVGGRSRRAVGVAWGSAALTALAFAGLHRLGVIGDLPLGLLLGLLVGAGVSGELAARYWSRNPTSGRLWVLVGVHMLAVTTIIYAIGWGVALAIGYLFMLARDLDDIDSRVWRPALVWTLAGIAAGQLAIAVGLVPTYVTEPGVHALAALMALGVAFVMQVLGTKTADQERSESELRASEADFRQLFADNPQPMWVYDAGTLAFLAVNEAAVGHYGYSHEEFMGRRVTDLHPTQEVPRLAEELRRPTPRAHADAWQHQLKDGRVVDVEVDSHEFVFEGRRAMLAAVQDVTRRNALEAELRHQAFHDSLTNLANRALFTDRVDHALRAQARETSTIALLVLDLDGFKTVNDSLGHTAGDALLVEVATRLVSILRPGDTAARLGGDEFAILLEHVADLDDAVSVAQRAIGAVAEPVGLSGKEVFIQASVGIALGADGRSADELLRDADAAMYQAKSDGKGRHRLFDTSMHSAAMARLELEGDLRRAIDAREFILHYQPLASLGTGEVVSLEALIRWQHPERGLLPPSEFIPLAEENGLIVDIGRWVLREACTRAGAWQRAYPSLRLTIAVNLSARQLADPLLVHDVSTALAETGLDPSSLILEITESVLIEDADAAVARLRQLKSTGVRLAIDDFGTGYSSLSSLQSLPVDILKIDKAFIDGVTSGAEADGLVQAILRLARTFHLVTVAEGVERPDQLERLRQLGCQQIQGFWYSRPLADDRVEEFLYQHSRGVPSETQLA